MRAARSARESRRNDDAMFERDEMVGPSIMVQFGGNAGMGFNVPLNSMADMESLSSRLHGLRLILAMAQVCAAGQRDALRERERDARAIAASSVPIPSPIPSPHPILAPARPSSENFGAAPSLIISSRGTRAIPDACPLYVCVCVRGPSSLLPLPLSAQRRRRLGRAPRGRD